MENLELLIGALGYIEENLTENIKTEDVANHLYCSKSTVEKLFKYFNRISIRDYMIRRRMSKAAQDIRCCPKKTLLDIGINYGYSSNEAFTRAFSSVWHTSPSEFRKNPAKYELFPPIRPERDLMEDKRMSSRRKIDISELYDCIRERKNCYFVIGDIKALIPINDISFQAGDLAIITSMKRMEEAAGEDDYLFRIGGDEFVILTNSEDEAYANEICEKVKSKNGDTIEWEGHQIPLTLYTKAVKFNYSCLRYSELFTFLQDSISDEYKAELDRNKNQ